MWCIAKEDPLGIVQEVQPEGSYFWGCAADAPLSQEIHEELFYLLKLHILWLRLLLLCTWL